MSIRYLRSALDGVARSAEKLNDIKRRLFYRTDNSDLYKHKVSPSLFLPDRRTRDIAHGIIGAATEAGELCEALQGIIASKGEAIDTVNIKEEVGDILFYLANLGDACGFTLDEAMAANIEKLRVRFPDGFNESHALKRDTDAERDALKG